MININSANAHPIPYRPEYLKLIENLRKLAEDYEVFRGNRHITPEKADHDFKKCFDNYKNKKVKNPPEISIKTFAYRAHKLITAHFPKKPDYTEINRFYACLEQIRSNLYYEKIQIIDKLEQTKSRCYYLALAMQLISNGSALPEGIEKINLLSELTNLIKSNSNPATI